MTLIQLKALGAQTDSAYQAYLADAASRQQARRQQSTTRRAASPPPQAQDEREGSHLGSAFRKIGHGFRDIFK